jgi:hypothetical protein
LRVWFSAHASDDAATQWPNEKRTYFGEVVDQVD